MLLAVSTFVCIILITALMTYLARSRLARHLADVTHCCWLVKRLGGVRSGLSAEYAFAATVEYRSTAGSDNSGVLTSAPPVDCYRQQLTTLLQASLDVGRL